MHEDFWQERWQRNEIGFHQAQVNPYLQRHWSALALPPGTQVLVPLCGKSLDLVWLAGQGYRVLGVELAESAVQAFFAEQGLNPEIDQYGAFRRYRAGGIELLCGDFFALQASEVRECHGLYDRAALIALPEALRERYVAHLAAVLPARCVGLLVSMDYPQEQMAGPPFAVSDAWVREWLEPEWAVQWLEEQDVLAENPRFVQRGLTRMQERVYRLARR